MKKIFMIAVASALLLSLSVSAQSFKKDTCCPCVQPKPVKKTLPAPRPWIYVVEEKKAKGLITKSFNDSIVVEDYAGSGTIFPGIPNVPERFFPPAVSNLKEVSGSFNRHITFKRMPAPEYHHHHHDDWFWVPFLLLLLLVSLIGFFLLRKKDVSPVSIEINTPPSPPAPTHRTAVAPALDMKEMFKQAADTGCTLQVFDNGGFKVIPPVKKEEKQPDGEAKKEEK